MHNACNIKRFPEPLKLISRSYIKNCLELRPRRKAKERRGELLCSFPGCILGESPKLKTNGQMERLPK